MEVDKAKLHQEIVSFFNNKKKKYNIYYALDSVQRRFKITEEQARKILKIDWKQGRRELLKRKYINVGKVLNFLNEELAKGTTWPIIKDKCHEKFFLTSADIYNIFKSLTEKMSNSLKFKTYLAFSNIENLMKNELSVAVVLGMINLNKFNIDNINRYQAWYLIFTTNAGAWTIRKYFEDIS